MSTFREKQNVLSTGEMIFPSRERICCLKCFWNYLSFVCCRGMLTNSVIAHLPFAFSVKMLDGTLKITNGLSLLRVSAKQKPNVDNFP